MSTRETAEKLVKKMSIDDQRALMVEEGEFKQEPSTEPYDQFKVGQKWFLNAMSMPIPDVREKAIAGMMKRIERGDVQVPTSSSFGGN